MVSHVYTVRTSARLLGVSVARVYQLINEGKLVDMRDGHTRLVSGPSVDQLIVIRERGRRYVSSGR